MSDGPIENFSSFLRYWGHRSFGGRLPADPEASRASSGADSSANGHSEDHPAWHEALRALMYGNARIEFTTLYRPDGSTARQMVASLGIRPVGRAAVRMTLDSASGVPNAVHGEIILGPRPYSVGGSIGRSRSEIIITWFRRRQPSIFFTNRELNRIVVENGQPVLQHIGELKFYGRSLSSIEIGEAVSYQFSREHLREAYRILGREGSVPAAAFLKRNYPYIDESLVGRAMRRPGLGFLGFAAEISAFLLVGFGIADLVPEGPLRHSLQSGSAFAVSNLFRGGWNVLRPRSLALAVGEGIPVAMVHGLISTGLDEMGVRSRYRWLAEDFGSLAVYGRLKSFFYLPNRGATARSLSGASLGLESAALGEGLWNARRYLRIGGALASSALLVGGIYFFARSASLPDVDFEDIERRYGASERTRLGIPSAHAAERGSDEPPSSGVHRNFHDRSSDRRRVREEQRRSAFILARILEGGSEAGALGRFLQAGGTQYQFEAALGRLTPRQRQTLGDRIDGATWNTLLSLSRESDRLMFYEGLYTLALYLEDRNEGTDLAAALLYAVQMQEENAPLRERARRALNGSLHSGAVLSRGPFFEAPYPY